MGKSIREPINAFHFVRLDTLAFIGNGMGSVCEYSALRCDALSGGNLIVTAREKTNLAVH